MGEAHYRGHQILTLQAVLSLRKASILTTWEWDHKQPIFLQNCLLYLEGRFSTPSRRICGDWNVPSVRQRKKLSQWTIRLVLLNASYAVLETENQCIRFTSKEVKTGLFLAGWKNIFSSPHILIVFSIKNGFIFLCLCLHPTHPVRFW